MDEAEGIDLDSTRCRAGRALLGWTQQELALQADVATSTVADFERGKRTPVTNNLEAMLRALEAAGVDFRGGSVAMAGARPSQAAPLAAAGSPVRFVDATDLTLWAERRDSHEYFPELVRRLILATTGNSLKQLDFKSQDSIQQPGWDGICEWDGPASIPFLPAGWSGWELGNQKEKIAAKASADYDKRPAPGEAIDPALGTFVFATLRRWAGAAKWVKEKRVEGKWADVRVLDADALAQWIELFPWVGCWLATHLGKRPLGIFELTEAWEEWRLSTRYRMSDDLLLAGRDSEASAVLRWLYQPPSSFALQAESPQEAIAFLYAAVGQLPVQYRLFYHSRCLIATSEDSARLLGAGSAPLVLVLDTTDAGMATRLVERGHHVFLPYGSFASAASNPHRLPRASRELFEDALRGMDVPDGEVERLSRESARNISILRRLIPSAPAAQAPAWATAPEARQLLPVLLAGAWDSAYAEDKNTLSRLAGVPYDSLEASLAAWVGVPDSPLRNAGTSWKIASPLDAWFHLARFLTRSDLDVLVAEIKTVLGEVDARFELEADKRWMSGERAAHSELLRSGLSETLILLALHGDAIGNVSGAASQVDSVVSQLLNSDDPRHWWSIAPLLPTLAEASPESFLAAVDASLASSAKVVLSLFEEDGGMFSSSRHPNLLWALERLAWSQDHFARVAGMLAALARLEPGGQLINRPKNSLRDLFLLWAPQTHAPLDERLRVLDRLRKSEPDVAWGLMLAITPTSHDSMLPAAEPRWREFSAKRPEVVTNGLILEGAVAVAQRLLEDVGSASSRWAQLLERYPSMTPESRAPVRTRLAAAVQEMVGKEAKQQVWKALAQLLHQHRSFPAQDWALPADELDRLELVLKDLEPREAVDRSAWLFSHEAGQLLPKPAGEDWEANEAELANQRRAAVTEVFSTQGAKGLIEFARAVAVPGYLGVAAAKCLSRPEEVEDAIAEARRQVDGQTGPFLEALLGAGQERFGIAWTQKLIRSARDEHWPDEDALRLLLTMPANSATWELLSAFPEAVSVDYWKRVHLFWAPGHEQDAVVGIERLIQAGRAGSALQLLASARTTVQSELLVKTLRAAAQSAGADDIDIQSRATMSQWAVEQILQKLDRAGDVPDSEIASLEWIYLALLSRSRRPPTVLYRFMASDPSFFAEIVCAVFKPSSGAEPQAKDGDERSRATAAQAYRLLDSWRQVPGLSDGRLDGIALKRWMKEARELCAKADRAAVGDRNIGKVLAFSPADADGAWPAVAVREVIEETRSADIEIGVLRGHHAKRGVTSRRVLEGGVQERAKAAEFHAWSDATRVEWPRTSSLLRRMARAFEEEGRRHDDGAERTDWSF